MIVNVGEGSRVTSIVPFSWDSNSVTSRSPTVDGSRIFTSSRNGAPLFDIRRTAVSTMAAIFMTPLNLSLWGSLHPETDAILRSVHLSAVDVFVTIFVVLCIPLIVGQLLRRIFPGLSDKVRRPFRIFALVFFILIVAAAPAANWQTFVRYVGFVIPVVFFHSFIALNLGFWSARALGLREEDRRAVCLEVGIQNSALGLVLVFNFFEGLGGMAILVASWGVRQIISGLAASFVLVRRRLPAEESEA